MTTGQKQFSFCDVCGTYLQPGDGVLDHDTGEILCGCCASRTIPQAPDEVVQEFVDKYHLADGEQNGDF